MLVGFLRCWSLCTTADQCGQNPACLHDATHNGNYIIRLLLITFPNNAYLQFSSICFTQAQPVRGYLLSSFFRMSLASWLKYGGNVNRPWRIYMMDDKVTRIRSLVSVTCLYLVHCLLPVLSRKWWLQKETNTYNPVWTQIQALLLKHTQYKDSSHEWLMLKSCYLQILI